MNKKAQVTIFIILAIVIVAGVALFFVLRENISPAKTSSEFGPIYADFISCAKQKPNQEFPF